VQARASMNITRDEAQSRARVISVDAYDVELDLTREEPTFPSTTVVRFRCTEPGASTFVDLVAPSLREVELNGRALDPAEVFDGTRISLDDLGAENTLRVAADCRYMNTGEGLHRFIDPVDKAVYLYTQFEVADSRRMFAVFEQPDLKASFRFTVLAPAEWQVISNAPAPSPEPAAGGSATWRFPATQRMSSYITALVAGPYHRIEDQYRSGDRVVPLSLYCRASLAEHLDADVIFEETRQGFEFFERVFDFPYPFEKYDQLFVPEFNAGAMENAGCVTHNEDYVFRSRVPEVAYERRAVTILHEMAHMWFGDLVTMTWWNDLWLNESFAEYASTLAAAEATKWRSAWTTFANTDKTWAYRQDQLPSTHPIAAEINDLEDVEVNFDGITYAKGASVLKLLVAWVGPDQFMQGIQRYFRTFAWGNTTLSDLLGKLEETSGRDLKAWSAEWLETAGVNTLRPDFRHDDEGRFTRFTVTQ
jgi:aminopeptidase N